MDPNAGKKVEEVTEESVEDRMGTGAKVLPQGVAAQELWKPYRLKNETTEMYRVRRRIIQYYRELSALPPGNRKAKVFKIYLAHVQSYGIAVKAQMPAGLEQGGESLSEKKSP